MRVIMVFLALIVCVMGAPWLDLVFGGSQDYRYNQRQRHRQGKGGKERWKEICRTINPDSFAYPGQPPYLSSPVCPW